jgi:hypothetical protein
LEGVAFPRSAILTRMGWNWEEPSKEGREDESGDEGDSEEEEEEEEKESVREGDSSEGLVDMTCGGKR